MKFMLAWTIEPSRYDEVTKRFVEGKEKIRRD